MSEQLKDSITNLARATESLEQLRYDAWFANYTRDRRKAQEELEYERALAQSRVHALDSTRPRTEGIGVMCASCRLNIVVIPVSECMRPAYCEECQPCESN